MKSEIGLYGIWFATVILSAYVFAQLKAWGTNESATAYAPALVVTTLTLLGLHLRNADVGRPWRIVVVGSTLVLAAYNFFAEISFPLSEWPDSTWFRFLGEYGGILSVLFAILTFWRPAFALAVCGLVFWKKVALAEISGVRGTPTDWTVLPDTASLMVVAAIAGIGLVKVSRRLSPYALPDRDPLYGLRFSDLVLLSAIALHFGNYFYSGIYKATIGEHWYQWTLYNPTEVLMLAAYVSGTLPLSFTETFAANIYQIAENFRIPLNVLIFLGQSSAILLILRIRYALAATIFYDITHVAIFLLTGIFFWKWIFLNMFIVAALYEIQWRRLSPACMLFLPVLVFVSPSFIFITKLAWFDTPAFNNIKVSAVTNSGNIVPVPSNHFLAYSVRFAQQRIGQPDKSDHFSTGTWGATLDPDILRAAQDCADFPLNSSQSNPGAYLKRDEAANVFRDTHTYLLQHAGTDGQYPIDFYPHHIWSMPWRFPEYYDLDLRDITAYRLTVESGCLKVVDDNIVFDLRLSGYTDIPVRPSHDASANDTE